MASQERLSEVIMEPPFFFFVSFSPSPLLSFSSSPLHCSSLSLSQSSTRLYCQLSCSLHTHTHTHTHTHSQLLHVSLLDVSTVTPVKQEPNVPTADSLMLLPPRNNNVWSQRENQNTQNFRRGTRKGAHWSTACPRQRGTPRIVSGPLWSLTVRTLPRLI